MSALMTSEVWTSPVPLSVIAGLMWTSPFPIVLGGPLLWVVVISGSSFKATALGITLPFGRMGAGIE